VSAGRTHMRDNDEQRDVPLGADDFVRLADCMTFASFTLAAKSLHNADSVLTDPALSGVSAGGFHSCSSPRALPIAGDTGEAARSAPESFIAPPC
jgi:hypothetical protein